ncbi:MAG: ankyrin repeat domain-containing protein [Acidobacteria bacterium]|nr:ankyrin repeat domain-containing protein [Acidobacteriota bacterium]
MNTEWERINQLFHQAMECTDEERAEFIARASQNDPALQREVQSLISMLEENNGFMEVPALGTGLSRQFGKWQRQIVDALLAPAGKFSSGTDRLIGQLLDGKYEIEALCGRGGMGAVYRATHVGTGRRVAVKVIAPELAGNSEFIERFRREAKTIGLLRHPNIVNVTDFGISGAGEQTIAYLVMEYLEGQTLAERLKNRRPMPINETIGILSQICEAMDEAHRLGILHRDLKPENIWLETSDLACSNGGNVKVLDFGNARLQDLLAYDELEPQPEYSEPAIRHPLFSITEEETLRLNYTAQQLSRFGSVMGTPKYMSPEQCLGERLDKTSDVYSLGVIAYQMLAGDPPFTGTIGELLVQHRQADPIPLGEKRRDIPIGVDAVVRQALAKEKKARPPSAGAFALQLQLHYAFHLQFYSAGNEWTRQQADSLSRKYRWKLFVIALRMQWQSWLLSLLLLFATVKLPGMSSVMSVALFGLFWLIIVAIALWGQNRTTAACTLLIGQTNGVTKPEAGLHSIIHAVKQRSVDLALASVAEIFSLIRGCLSLKFSEIRRGFDNTLIVPSLIEEGHSVNEARKRSAILMEPIRQKTRYLFLRRLLGIALYMNALQVIPLIGLPMLQWAMTSPPGKGIKILPLLIYPLLILTFVMGAFRLSLKIAVEQTMLYLTARKTLGEIPLEQSAVLPIHGSERGAARWRAYWKTYVPIYMFIVVITGFYLLKLLVMMEAEIGIGNLNKVKIMHASGVPVPGWSLRPDMISRATSHPMMVKYLIEKGAEVNALIRVVGHRGHYYGIGTWAPPHGIHQVDFVTTPLMIALAQGSFDTARLLIERGANVHAQDSFGRTPMTIALCDRPQAIELLLASGVDINEQTRFGTPLLTAARYQWPWPETMPQYHFVLQQNRFVLLGNRILHQDEELIRERDNAVRILIEKGADPNTRDSEGRNALMLMSMEARGDNDPKLADAELTIETRETLEPRYRWRRHDKAVELTGETLLNAGCDVNAADNKGRTPLMYAVIFERRVAVDLLLKRGANIHTKDHDGLSALDWAKKSGNDDLVRFLDDIIRLDSAFSSFGGKKTSR